MVEKFKASHYQKLHLWWSKRKLEPVPYNLLPKIGYVVDDCVAGFLYQTDSTLCFMDSFISNPSASKSERELALDSLERELIKIAKLLGFEKIIAMTKHEKMKSRAQARGYTMVDDFTIYSKEL